MFNISLYRLVRAYKDKNKSSSTYRYPTREVPFQSYNVRRCCSLNSVILDEDYFVCRKCEQFNLCSHGLGFALA